MEQEHDPQQEKRVLTAVVASVAVLWVFSTFVFKPPPAPEPLPEDATATAEVTPDAATPTPAPAPAPVVASAPAAEVRTLDRPWTGVESGWSSFGGSPNSMLIEAYQEPFKQLWLPTWLLSGFKDGFKIGRASCRERV